MDRTVFKTLAEGYIRQHAYEDDLRDAIDEVTEKHGGMTDFLGLPYDSFTLMSAVSDAIKQFDKYETFEYFYYECGADWDKFNKAIEWGEGEKKQHPECYNLDDLYDYILVENVMANSTKKSAQEN